MKIGYGLMLPALLFSRVPITQIPPYFRTQTLNAATMKGHSVPSLDIARLTPIQEQIVVNTRSLRTFFSRIPQDPYVSEGFRFKAIARVTVTDDGLLVLQPHGPLFQSAEINPTHGDISRNYPPIEDKLFADPVFKLIIKKFAQAFHLRANQEILVQVQLIKCSSRLLGKTAVEGIHRDGVIALGIVCLGKRNLLPDAAVTLITDHKREQVLFNGVLSPGQGLFLFDDRSHHYTTDVTCVSNHEGYRAVMLLSYPAARPGQPMVPLKDIA